MHILSALLLAIAANVDNFAVGIAYGIKKLQIGWLTNLFIGLISASGTYLAISVGNDIKNYLSVNVANALGSFILIAVGIWSIWKTLKRQHRKVKMRQEMRFLVAAGSNRAISNSSHSDASQEFLHEFSYEKFLEDPEKADLDHSGYIDVRESIALAFGLTLNNLGSGLGGGISNLNVAITTFLVFILSLLGISGGYFLGDRFTTKISGLWAGILSAALVIITGVYEYFIMP
ncbi:sporulation membrane protein YtaF [Tolypothrix sp. PCC 7910]|uniref:sporulation membrane protein YtaF n=1 Tax=Tolypothrix sp. PCC 7910 TaxID=2099387 RepID=UPI0014278A49|nr:sporulation membrane protein YtaF [Tolypothrix sp. PCC 7910]QIR35850.1 sporulation membrane protein YtaF [Tolypothrix sp. PCC 7910]